MEATELPKKIYISAIPSELGGNKTITCGKDFPHAVEYVRTDDFIEKACKWLKENVLFTHPRKGTKVCAVNLIAFVDAMKGE